MYGDKPLPKAICITIAKGLIADSAKVYARSNNLDAKELRQILLDIVRDLDT